MLGGIGMIILTPPFMAADEPAHFLRSFHLSEGHLSVGISRRGIGVKVPRSLWAIYTPFREVAGDPQRTVRPEEIMDAMSIPLRSADRAWISLLGVARYAPVLYIPQALGIAAARPFGASALALLYAARFFNLLVSTLLIFWAIRLTPSFRWVFAFVGLLPMTLFVRSSVSADAGLIAGATLVAAALVRCVGEESLSRKSGIAAVIGTLIVTFSKLVYFLLPLTLATVMLRHRKGRLVTGGLVAGIGLLGTLLSAVYAQRFSQAYRPGVNAIAQLHYSIQHPATVASIVARDFVVHAPRFARQFVGNLGWLDTPVPSWLVVLVLAALLAIAGLDNPERQRFDRVERMFILSAVVLTCLLISFSQYLTWTPVGAAFVDGVTGRYFLPVAPFALLLLMNRRFADRADLVPLVAGPVLVLSTAAALGVLLLRFFG